MVVPGSESLEQRDRLEVGVRALARPVGPVDGRLARAVDDHYVGALRKEIPDHLVVAPRRRVVQGSVPFVIARAHVEGELLDQVTDRAHPAARVKSMTI